MSDEIKGSLKDLETEGNLLADRFASLQRRNVIETRVKTRPEKVKVRKYFKKDHRLWMQERGLLQ